MPIVTFLPSQKSIGVPIGTTLFQAASLVGLPIASSCSEEGVCGKCNLQVVSGEENLSGRLELEVTLLRREKNSPTDRISCLAIVNGDCTVKARYW